ncbi:MAG: basic amino acid ABC transporter substrate-binding protein [Candidatus Zixiibacteriota bacterium]
MNLRVPRAGLPAAQWIPLIGVCCLLLLAFWRCGGHESGWSRLSRTGVLRVGTDATYPPFEWIDTASGHVEGFDVDLVREICRELHCAPEFVVVPFDGIIAGLVSEKYDLIASTFTITPERARHVAFSDPYYDAGQALAVPVSDTTIRSVDDLVGRTVGVQLGTTGERRAAQIPRVKVVSFENIGAAFIDMENRRLDAVINDRPTTELIIRQRRAAKIVGPTLTAENYGLAVRKDDPELLERINRALARIKSDGRFQIIHDRWFGPGG